MSNINLTKEVKEKLYKNKTIDIYDFFKNDSLKKTNIISNEKDKNVNNKSKREVNKEGFTIHNLEVNKCLLKALECKALTENVTLDELINDLLKQSVEKRYYVG